MLDRTPLSVVWSNEMCTVVDAAFSRAERGLTLSSLKELKNDTSKYVLWVHRAWQRNSVIVRLASYSDARTRTRRGLVTAQCHRHEHGSRLIEKPRLKAICSFLAGGRQKDAKVVRWRLN